METNAYANEINVQADIETTTHYETEPVMLEQMTTYSLPHIVENINSSDISIDIGGNKSNESIESSNVKVIENDEKVKTPESASKVLLPSVSNVPSNNFKYQTKTREVRTEKEAVNSVAKSRHTKQLIEKKNDIRAHVQYDEVTGELIGGDHPCQRECVEGEEPMICYYHFNLEWYQTMSKACYNCPYNATDCKRLDCIPADGINRALNVVNRKMPGPAIEVCQHDRIIVDVENDLMTEGTTVHWHGQHQRGTPYMDGTPYVTQCPILPESTFRYQFNATHAGTHFWHSHSGMQRADGAAGALIIRKPKSQDPYGNMYDYDKSEHVIIVTDWIHELSVGMFTDHHHAKGDNKPPTLLINGVGRFRFFNDSSRPTYMQAARFDVEQGYKYRFRVINAEFLNCPIEMSVDGHNITVIASDGYELEAITGKFDFKLFCTIFKNSIAIK
ncbi:unnamed protein product [Euphydryas editha]|uniref:Laccase n=1 Tax=Euphydryas editha TaxID=104508 RepID=A0AAU9UJG7_EUPED|nr:unnamed protein product [Euphydryas editha]